MRFLFDVNALVALGFRRHEFHERVLRWVRSLRRQPTPEMLTCSITELGFVRVLVQTPLYALEFSEARDLLLGLKRSEIVKMTFIADDHDLSRLPAWVKTARQITDGHLAELAEDHGAMLATLDRRIPRSFLIP